MEDPIISFLNDINRGADYLVAVLLVLGALYLTIRYTIKRIQKYVLAGEGAYKGIFLGILMLAEMTLACFVLIWFPVGLAKAVTPGDQTYRDVYNLSWVFRWLLIFMATPPLIWLMTRKYSGFRGLYAAIFVLTIALFGWFYQHWFGIVLISLPIYAALGWLIYQLAQVVLPARHPENRDERWLKFRALLAYLLSFQFPVWVAVASASREFEERIKGNNFSGAIEPGIVWTHAHQVAGISAGIEFMQVEGPGLIFTKIYGRPIALVDLRTQIRTTEFDAITKDGIAIKAVLFTAFVIDFEDWPKSNWDDDQIKKMREDIIQNPYLRKGIKVDQKVGSYWYSTARVKSVLSMAGINTTPKDGDTGPVVYWDEWVLKQIENVARQVLSQRTIDELWRPLKNDADTSALDEIAGEIRKIVEPPLRRGGIHLYGCRVVNFNLPEDSPIRKQQIESWETLWNQRITKTKSEAAAIRKEEIEKAHAHAKSEILAAIAESIEKARALHHDLPRHVIALYYIHAIEEVMQKQAEPPSPEAKERLDTIKSYLLFNQ
jgi:hypothetical protein